MKLYKHGKIGTMAELFWRRASRYQAGDGKIENRQVLKETSPFHA